MRKFKLLPSAVLIAIAMLCGSGCSREKVKKTDVYAKLFVIDSIAIIKVKDGLCGLPIYGCLYGVKLIDSSAIIIVDTTIIKLLLKKIPMKDTINGRWFAVNDEVIKITFVKNLMTNAFVGKATGEDSIILANY